MERRYVRLSQMFTVMKGCRGLGHSECDARPTVMSPRARACLVFPGRRNRGRCAHHGIVYFLVKAEMKTWLTWLNHVVDLDVALPRGVRLSPGVDSSTMLGCVS